MDIRDFLEEVESGPLLGAHKKRMEALMRHFSANDIPLATCADPRHLRRSLSTLQSYAREFSLKFPDYVPMKLRPPKPPKVRKKRERKTAPAPSISTGG